MNTKIYCVLLISFFGWKNALAQGQVDSTLAKYYRTNFAVPNNPAFNILGTQPSELLRPTDIKELSVVASNFFNGNSAVLPKSYSVEIAPYLVARANNIQLKDLSETALRILSSVRISIGTDLSGNGSVRNAAAGIRVSIIDKGDLRYNKSFVDELVLKLQTRQELDQLMVVQFGGPCPIEDIACNEARNKIIALKVDSLERLSAKRDSILGKDPGSLDKKIFNLREYYKAQYWNAEKLDFAAAILGSSPDSLARNIKFNRVTVWGTYAFPVKNWGQWLIGGNFTNMNRDSLFANVEKPITIKSTNVTLSTRLYAGVNRLKGFVEYQAKFLNEAYSVATGKEKNSFFNALWNLGGEANVVDGIWLNFSAGLRYSTNANQPRSEFVGSFNIRFALPEKFKLN